MPGEGCTLRDDVIAITDEAHSTQYGALALNMRNALRNAGYIGFTGMPLFPGDFRVYPTVPSPYYEVAAAA